MEKCWSHWKTNDMQNMIQNKSIMCYKVVINIKTQTLNEQNLVLDNVMHTTWRGDMHLWEFTTFASHHHKVSVSLHGKVH